MFQLAKHKNKANYVHGAAGLNYLTIPPRCHEVIVKLVWGDIFWLEIQFFMITTSYEPQYQCVDHHFKFLPQGTLAVLTNGGNGNQMVMP